MFCKNCGKQNDDNNKFCVNCGQPLTTDSRAFFHNAVNTPHPEQHIFDTPEVQRTEKTDTGYFIIAVLTAINVAGWLILSSTARNANASYLSFYKIIRVLSVLLLITQFIVSFFFTKKEIYKTVIVVLGLLCSAFYIYYLIDDLKRL